jgi:hypothetical protein
MKNLSRYPIGTDVGYPRKAQEETVSDEKSANVGHLRDRQYTANKEWIDGAHNVF